MNYDLCLAWNWEFDAGFVRLLQAACAQRGLAFLEVTPDSLDLILAALENGEIHFHTFFDRASDSDPRFQPLVDRARKNGSLRINPQEKAHWAWDKATMHLEFISRGLPTPYTIILPPHCEQQHLQDLNIELLGSSFAIKPAAGGGGWGVVLEATSPEQVYAMRQEYPFEKVLLQTQIKPTLLDGQPAWFRILYCNGAVYPCWWDTHTHIYARVKAEQSFRFGLRNLREIPHRIAHICKLDLFSTEIALTADGQFLVSDYANDPVDLRLQSAAVDGVPDVIVENISGRLAGMALQNKPPNTPFVG